MVRPLKDEFPAKMRKAQEVRKRVVVHGVSFERFVAMVDEWAFWTADEFNIRSKR
jgi:hypothetical protein